MAALPTLPRILVTGAVTAMILAIAGPAAARKRKAEPPPPPVPVRGDLSALTVPIEGDYRRESSSDNVVDMVLEPGQTMVLADLDGPGTIDRLFIAIEGADSFPRDVVLRITWDGAAGPSVQAPLGDFFAVGSGAGQDLQSSPMVVASQGRAFTSLWKMPFSKSALIEIENQGGHETRHLSWEVSWRKQERLPQGSLYFHAQYNQVAPAQDGVSMPVLRASGTGQFVGLAMTVRVGEPGTWNNGLVHFRVDGSDRKGPGDLSLANYFGFLFGMQPGPGATQGCTLDEGTREGARASVYRFHLDDPVAFGSSIEVSVDHGPRNGRDDHQATVAYWYQDQPAVPFVKLAAARDRRWPAPTREELTLWDRADELNKTVLDAYRAGDMDAARTGLEELIEVEPHSVYASYNLACLYALQGDTDKALHMLTQAIDLGFTELSFARHDPDLANLRDHERFRFLVKWEDAEEAAPAKE